MKKTYTAWTKSGKNPEVLTECKADSAKDFKAIVERNGAKVTSRIRIKRVKNEFHHHRPGR